MEKAPQLRGFLLLTRRGPRISEPTKNPAFAGFAFDPASLLAAQALGQAEHEQQQVLVSPDLIFQPGVGR